MLDDRSVLTLAHSPDPDDAFMWWPITGKVTPGEADRVASPPAIETGRFRFRAVPRDINALNRHAAEGADPYDITALSARAYADVADRYALTACGASFGDGYGPKLVCREGAPLRCEGCVRAQRPLIAVPGARTTAFLVLSLMVGAPLRYVEMPFDAVIAAVGRGEADAGLVIHEGQLTFTDAGLRQVADLGEWWKTRMGLPLPLGVNAVRRDLEERFGAGTMREIAVTLSRSLRHALERREESIDYAMGFAMANAGSGVITRERVERFVDMYVNRWTVDMGDAGREAVRRLLNEGSRAGLCPEVGEVRAVA